MTPCLADEGAKYRIRVQGRLDAAWAARLGDMTLAVDDRGGETVVTDVTGWITDQAALMGVLQQFYAMGVMLLSVERLDEEDAGSRDD
jgi:hypothetical protein